MQYIVETNKKLLGTVAILYIFDILFNHLIQYRGGMLHIRI